MNNISRRRFLTGACVGAGAALASSQVAAFGLGKVLGGGGDSGGGGAEASAEDFKKYLSAGTCCLLKGIGELITAIEDKTKAEKYFSYAEATKKNDADFKEIQPLIDEASDMDLDALAKSNADKAGPHVAKAYLYTALAAAMDLKAKDSAQEVISSGSKSMAVVKVAGTAKDAVKALPKHVELATTIVGKTKEYIDVNGLSLPSMDEAKKIAENDFGVEGKELNLG